MMSLNSVLVLILAFITGNALSHGTWQAFLYSPSGYLGLSVLALAVALAHIALDQSQRPRGAQKQFAVLVVGFGLVLLSVANWQLQARQAFAPPAFRGDGITQSVVAAQALVAGQNPYTYNYDASPFAAFTSPRGDGFRNVAYDHYAYPPLAFLIYVPSALAERWWSVDFDAESLYLPIFLGLVAVLVFATSSWTLRNRILILTIANPFVWVDVFVGYNDFLFLFLLLAAVLAFHRRQWWLAGLVFGLAIAAKQTVWLLLPVWAFWLWQRRRQGHSSRVEVRRISYGTLATAGAVVLPFLAWNAGAMYDDTVRYISGTIPNSFPIANTTLAQYLHRWGSVDPWSTMPLWPLLLVGLAPVAWWIVRRLRRDASIPALLTSSAVLLLVATLFNRVGSENYFLAPIILALAAYVYDERQPATP